MQLKIKMKKGCEDLFPKKAHQNDACFDIYSAETVTIMPDKQCMVSTGVHMDIPVGYEVVFRGRSGNCAKRELWNHYGTIDTGYVDECKVIVRNQSKFPYTIARGDRIAQFKVQEVIPTELVLVDEFETESRGGGFGSSGK